MTTAQKISAGCLCLLLAGICYVLSLVIGFAGHHYTKSEMAGHYERHREDFAKAISDIRDVCNGVKLDVEFDGRTVEIFHTKNPHYSRNWPHGASHLVDSIAASISLDRQGLNEIRRALNSIDCIGYSNMGEGRTSLAKGRAAFSMYGYEIYDKPLSTNEMAAANDSCYQYLYTPTIVFTFGSGAIGPECMGEAFFR